MIQDYIEKIINKNESENPLNLAKEESEIKNPIADLADKILNTRIDKITRKDVESFVKQIYKIEATPSEITELKEKIAKASWKILEKEKMSLAKSYSETSVDRHKKNYFFIETFLKVHALDGGASRESHMLKDIKKIVIKMFKKDITSITSEDIDKVVLLAKKLVVMHNNEIEYQRKIMQFTKQELVQPKFYSDPSIMRMAEISNVAVILKLIDREEISLENSFFEEAKERHTENIRALKSLITPFIRWDTI